MLFLALLFNLSVFLPGFAGPLHLTKHIPGFSCISKRWTQLGGSQLSSPGAAEACRDLARYVCLFVHYELCNGVYPPPTPSLHTHLCIFPG